MSFEERFERWGRRVFARNKVLSDKFGLTGKELGRTTDLFMATNMGKVGTAIILVFVFIALAALIVYPDKPAVTGAPFEEPSFEHPFGTDYIGRDLFVRIMQGTQPSLIVGFAAMAISMVLGTLVGLASGYWGGWKDEVIMRINDVFLSIPWLVLMLVLASVLQAQTLGTVILVIGVTGWSTTARIVRSQVLTLRTRQFVERARAIGSGDWHIIRRHVFPNVVPLIFANAILTVAIAILSESTLSYLKMGPKNVETWGKILEEASRYNTQLIGPYSYILIPGIFIVIIVLGFTFVGYAMDEVLNPKLRRR
ncbi:MAG: ABC transporter permease [Thermoplasmata archaeon]|jgi:peptide/nickel transport system permease protein|nr:ABC transporter permease [Thermoplasmata archaeon]